MVDSGATTTNGIPARCAPSACAYVPILLTTSPFAQIRSAPTITASTSPRAIRNGPAPSTATRKSTPAAAQLPRGQPGALQQRPRLRSDHPSQRARAGAARGPRPEPCPPTTAASAPVLQCVNIRGRSPAQRGHQVGTAHGHRLGRRDLLVAHRAGLLENGRRPVRQPRRSASRSAGQVHRRRARALDLSYGLSRAAVVSGVPPGGQCHPEGAGDARARARRVPRASVSPRPGPPPWCSRSTRSSPGSAV